MSPQQIVIVAVRLMAIFWLMHVLSRIGSGLVMMQEIDAPISRLWILVALQTAICAFLWFFPSTISSKLLKTGPSAKLEDPVEFAQWQQLAFVAVGVLVVALAIPDAIYWLIVFTASIDLSAHHQSLGLEQKASAFATLVELIVGVLLALGARGISAAMFKLRAAGVPSNKAP